jgi:hypothetical protein
MGGNRAGAALTAVVAGGWSNDGGCSASSATIGVAMEPSRPDAAGSQNRMRGI